MTVTYGRILLTLDGSPFAAQALPHGASLARQYAAELIVLRVIAGLHPHGLNYVPETLLPEVQAYTQGIQIRWVAEVQQEQAQVVTELRQSGINASSAIEVGDPAETILDFAENNRADLIVMSTHGRTGVQRFMYGSVAEKVLQGAPCPVLLVRVGHIA